MAFMSSNSAQSESINNPGFLKVDLLLKGIYLDKSARESDQIKRALAISKDLGLSSELDILLPCQIIVNVAFEEDASSTPYSLIKKNGSFLVSTGDESVEVEIIAPPPYYDKKTKTGVPFANIAKLYGEYLIVSPTRECEFLTKDLACFYCDVESRVDKKRSVEEVIETIKAVSKSNPVNLVCLNTGYEATPDGGIKAIEPYIKEIKKRFDVLIAVQAQPPLEDEWIDYTYALGVDSLAYNLEVYDPDIFAKIAPGKQQVIGRTRYLEALRRAAKVFPKGAVVSNLIIGIEPISSTIKGINALASMGVIPTLPILNTSSEELESAESLSVDDIAKVFLHLNRTLRKYKIADSWVSHANIAMNAIDGTHFGGDAAYKSRLDNLLKSRRGSKIARNLTKIRRSLRVKKVKD